MDFSASNRMDRFERDVESMAERLKRHYGREIWTRIDEMRDRLINLHRSNRVKVNHSIMELVMGAYLADRGYKVSLEHPLEDDLVADIMAWRNGRSMIVEVETGFTSPENALDPQSYLTARVISKMARYGVFADKFSLATPPHNILQIPTILLKPKRRRDGLKLLKDLCDRYYSTPGINLERLEAIKLHTIYIINVDTLKVKPLKPRTYLRLNKDLIPKLKDIKNYLRRPTFGAT